MLPIALRAILKDFNRKLFFFSCVFFKPVAGVIAVQGRERKLTADSNDLSFGRAVCARTNVFSLNYPYSLSRIVIKIVSYGKATVLHMFKRK